MMFYTKYSSITGFRMYTVKLLPAMLLQHCWLKLYIFPFANRPFVKLCRAHMQVVVHHTVRAQYADGSLPPHLLTLCIQKSYRLLFTSQLAVSLYTQSVCHWHLNWKDLIQQFGVQRSTHTILLFGFLRKQVCVNLNIQNKSRETNILSWFSKKLKFIFLGCPKPIKAFVSLWGAH